MCAFFILHSIIKICHKSIVIPFLIDRLTLRKNVFGVAQFIESRTLTKPDKFLMRLYFLLLV